MPIRATNARINMHLGCGGGRLITPMHGFEAPSTMRCPLTTAAAVFTKPSVQTCVASALLHGLNASRKRQTCVAISQAASGSIVTSLLEPLASVIICTTNLVEIHVCLRHQVQCRGSRAGPPVLCAAIGEAIPHVGCRKGCRGRRAGELGLEEWILAARGNDSDKSHRSQRGHGLDYCRTSGRCNNRGLLHL